MEHEAGCELREKLGPCTCGADLKISARLRREVENFGPMTQVGCPDILTEAAIAIDVLTGTLRYALEQLLVYEQERSGELYNSPRINAALSLAGE